MAGSPDLAGRVRVVADGIWGNSPDAEPGMRVPARICASEPRSRAMDAGVFEQVANAMETGSALLVGTARAMAETWGSTAHGAGRTMSRAQANRQVRGEQLIASMEDREIVVRAACRAGVAEEAGCAYEDLGAVVDALERLDIWRKVVTLTPIGNVKR